MQMPDKRIKPGKDKSADEERIWPRFRCNLPTELFDDSDNLRDCNIINISENGLGIRTDASLQKGRRIQLVDPKVKADVVWISKNRAGLVICE